MSNERNEGLSMVPVDSWKELSPGSKVFHDLYGEGDVISVSPDKARIKFGKEFKILKVSMAGLEMCKTGEDGGVDDEDSPGEGAVAIGTICDSVRDTAEGSSVVSESNEGNIEIEIGQLVEELRRIDSDWELGEKNFQEYFGGKIDSSLLGKLRERDPLLVSKKASIIRDFLEKVDGSNYPRVLDRLMENGMGKCVKVALERAKVLDRLEEIDKDMVLALVKAGCGELIFERLEKVEGIEHSEIASAYLAFISDHVSDFAGESKLRVWSEGIEKMLENLESLDVKVALEIMGLERDGEQKSLGSYNPEGGYLVGEYYDKFVGDRTEVFIGVWNSGLAGESVESILCNAEEEFSGELVDEIQLNCPGALSWIIQYIHAFKPGAIKGRIKPDEFPKLFEDSGCDEQQLIMYFDRFRREGLAMPVLEEIIKAGEHDFVLEKLNEGEIGLSGDEMQKIKQMLQEAE